MTQSSQSSQRTGSVLFAASLVLGCTLALLVLASDAIALPITEVSVPTPSAAPLGIATGPDSNVWFTEAQADRIGRVTSKGKVIEFAVPTTNRVLPEGGPTGITAGPDGNMWFTEPGANKIGRITPKGKVTEFTVPTTKADPTGITAGSEGSLWFTEATHNKIGRITPKGKVTEFLIPPHEGNPARPSGITVGQEGNLWFVNSYLIRSVATEYGIGRITPKGKVTEFSVPFEENGGGAIAAGPEGDLWFTGSGPTMIGKITPSGKVTDFQTPTKQSYPSGIGVGPDGNMWFTETDRNKIGRITPSGEISEFRIPTAESSPADITAGSDGNMWFTESQANQIGQIPARASPEAEGMVEPCKVESVEAKIGGNGIVGIFAGGDEGTVELATLADHSFTTALNGRFKVGLGGVFGEGANVSGVGGGGLSGSVAGGLELGFGAEFESPSNGAANSVIDALKRNPSPPKPSVSLKSTTFDFGAWLSGDVGIQGGHGEGEVQAVVGAKQSYEENKLTDTEYYLQIAASIKGLGSLPVDSAQTALSLGGELSGNWIIGETVNQAQEPVSAEVELSGTESVALKSPPASLASWLKDVAVQGSGGTEADLSVTLNLANPRTRRLWSQITEGSPHAQPESEILGELERESAATITTYSTATESFEANGKVGEGVGVRLDLNAEVTRKKLKPNGAFVKLPGSPTIILWSECTQAAKAIRGPIAPDVSPP